MAAVDPYVTAKANLRDNVKVLMTAFAGVVGVLLAGTPFTGLGSAEGLRLGLALLGLLVALACFTFGMKVLLQALRPDLMGYEVLRDDFDLDSIKDERTRKEIEALRKVFDGQRKALLPDGMGSYTVEALQAHVDALWDALPEGATDDDRYEYEQYKDMLDGLKYWAGLTRLLARVGSAMRHVFLLGIPALLGMLLFTWAVNPPKAEAKPTTVIVDRCCTAGPPAPASAPVGQSTRFGPVPFALNKADLDHAGHEVIRQAREALARSPRSVVLVEAHADTQGTERRNAHLAQERLDAVSRVLRTTGGIAPNRVFGSPLGTNAVPVITGAQVDEALNRSAWLTVLPGPVR
jgi:outer membrane protein OmpA-like peptidoglycan-associated protein